MHPQPVFLWHETGVCLQRRTVCPMVGGESRSAKKVVEPVNGGLAVGHGVWLTGIAKRIVQRLVQTHALCVGHTTDADYYGVHGHCRFFRHIPHAV